jgi:hypothetical protein
VKKFKKGDSVICLINSKSHLTVGKEYKIIDIVESDLSGWDEISLIIENDIGEIQWYNDIRFIHKQDFRTHLINDIIFYYNPLFKIKFVSE